MLVKLSDSQLYHVNEFCHGYMSARLQAFRLVIYFFIILLNFIPLYNNRLIRIGVFFFIYIISYLACSINACFVLISPSFLACLAESCI